MRVTHPDRETLKMVVTYFRDKCNVYLAVYEYAKITGHLHIHMLFEIDESKKSNLFQQWHNHFKGVFKGNSSFSCEKLKKELVDNWFYMCKGTRINPPDVIYNNDDKITMTDVGEYWNKYWSDKPIEQDYTLVNKRTKKVKSLTWSEELTLEIKKKNPCREWSYDKVDIELLNDYVLKALGQSSKKLSSFIVRDLILGQLNALNPNCITLRRKTLSEGFPDLSF